MNKNLGIYFGSVLILGVVSASAFAADIATNTARMQAMDKITGRVSEIDVPVNGLANFGTFSILVRKCVTKSPEETPENTAFVDVVDNYRSDNPVNIFKGWMFSSTPALNAVEHPIYDIWLLKCYNRPQDRAQLLSEEQLALRDSIPMSRPEKIDPKTSLSAPQLPEDTSPEQTPAEATVQPQMANDSITVEISSSDADIPSDTAEEDFVSEGEEPDVIIDAAPDITPDSTPSSDEDLADYPQED